MGLFGGNNRGNRPDGVAGLGARLGEALRGGGRSSAPAPAPRRRRGNAPDGVAGLGARLGERLFGRR
ncbi:hypothetical protein [Nigerium massiliense]|uniref:hypothetical protein n=1 Tax=Nigerium massiliense TaxID=1522317 RepID=UPI00058EB142|nr:hypothetical protein [Nigerium massiliense]